jgi:hypothetical protein
MASQCPVDGIAVWANQHEFCNCLKRLADHRARKR